MPLFSDPILGDLESLVLDAGGQVMETAAQLRSEHYDATRAYETNCVILAQADGSAAEEIGKQCHNYISLEVPA